MKRNTTTAKKTKAEKLQKALNLSELPDAGFIVKYERLSKLDNPKGVIYRQKGKKPSGKAENIRGFETRFQEALIADSVGGVLAKARTEQGLSLSQLAEKANLSRGRMAQLEQAENNLEIQTIVKQAQVLGYKVRLSLEPEDTKRTAISVVLPQ